MRTITISDGVRIRPHIFNSHIERTDTCWLWTGRLCMSGYGQYSAGSVAHRVAYRLWVGSIPEGMTVDHLCFVPTCVNPAHLRLLTLRENVANQREAFKTHCKHGHEFTPENTYRRTEACSGSRSCRRCNADAQALRRARLRSART